MTRPIVVIGLDCAAPELLLGDDALVHVRHLMSLGTYGRLESVIPPITVPAWMCMATSQDPGSLGIYGFRNRADHSYAGLETANSRSIRALAIWDQIAREGGRSTIVGVPPSFPPRKLNGNCVGCFLTPDPARSRFTFPDALQDEIATWVGEYPVDVKGFRTERKDWLLEEILQMTRAHFEVVRRLLDKRDWDYFQLVEIGLDRIQHGFWQHCDPQHVDFVEGNPYRDVIRDYYRLLDAEIGTLLERIPPEAIVLVVSDHGAQRLDGGFRINQWLVDEGLLVLREPPAAGTPFTPDLVDWSRTTAWSEGGYYARVFLNVRDREPAGTIAPADYARVRDDVAARIESIRLPSGEPMRNRAHRPESLYREVRGVAPDLVVHLGELYWRSIGNVGPGPLHVRENDTGPDGCNHAQHGAFVLAAAGVEPRGEMEAVRLLDIAPTLLALGGYDIPDTMLGRVFLEGGPVNDVSVSTDDEREVRERLSGLGYIQ